MKDICFLIAMATHGVHQALSACQTQEQLAQTYSAEVAAAQQMGTGVIAYLMDNSWYEVAVLVNSTLQQLDTAAMWVSETTAYALQTTPPAGSVIHARADRPPVALPYTSPHAAPTASTAARAGRPSTIASASHAGGNNTLPATDAILPAQPTAVAIEGADIGPKHQPQQPALMQAGTAVAEDAQHTTGLSDKFPVDPHNKIQLVKYAALSAMQSRFGNVQLAAAYMSWSLIQRAAMDRCMFAGLAIWCLLCLVTVSIPHANPIPACVGELTAMAVKLAPLAVLSSSRRLMSKSDHDKVAIAGELLRLGMIWAGSLSLTHLSDRIDGDEGSTSACFSMVLGFPRMAATCFPQTMTSWCGQVSRRPAEGCVCQQQMEPCRFSSEGN